jgi:3-phenylpropionate/cinnamic acid dioxygenase small subunit
MSALEQELRPAASLYYEVSQFLYFEARLLDEGRFREWLGLLHEDVRYRLVTPKLSSFTPGVSAQEEETLLMEENFNSFKIRVQQLTTPAFTIAENPRPFTRRYVANVMLEPVADDTSIHVYSNALVYRSRGTQMEPHLFSMSRRDRLRSVSGRLVLARRDARLDESVVTSRNITALW